MPNSKKILSRKLFVAFSFVYLLNIVVGGKLDPLFSLDTGKLVTTMEFWRLITFPLATGSFEGFLIAFFAFYYISPKLEEQLRNPFYTVLNLLLISLQGIIFTIVFWKTHVAIAGLEGISFFIITLFSLLNYKYNIKFSGLLRFRLIWVSIFLVFVWMMVKLSSFYMTGQIHELYSSFSIVFGGITGGMAYAQILYLQRIIMKNRVKDKIEMPSATELSLAILSQSKLAKFNSSLIDEYNKMEFDSTELNEDTLNLILDKINDKGKDSLSPDEIKFLDEYSKHIS
ncbi:MAG: rhomboid family intramembrane serine protease [Candidatus Kapabacteria bacterium]|nr:rhomboid family intramembrane serine protease [Candidatus Kapabacteria bacterium]